MSEDSDRGFFGKLVLTGLVLIFSPFVELVTGAAPIGTTGAIVALSTIWGFDLLGDAAEGE